MRVFPILKWLSIAVFVVLVVFLPSTLYFFDRVGLGLLGPRLENLSIHMEENWFPYANNRKGLQYWGERFFGGATDKHEVLQFSRPGSVFGKRKKIIFGKSEDVGGLYKNSSSSSPFVKSIKYAWGTADYLEDKVSAGGDITVVCKEYNLLIVTNDENALDDIKKIITMP